MPIYEFICGQCSHSFEELRLSSSDFKKISCPKCGSRKVSKEFSTFAAGVAGGSKPAGCADGSCDMPQMPGCSSGMCGLN
ncbi:MAG: hypothetical protein IEMM0002_0212 [bacterium]|nr:MAG: hypothetical protein IEMM0002_0212 [bacterium]